MIRKTVTIAVCVLIALYVLFGLVLSFIFRALARKIGDRFTFVDTLLITILWPTHVKWMMEGDVEEKKEQKD